MLKSEPASKRTRNHIVGLTMIGVLMTASSVLDVWPTRLVWNASPSMPVGLYWVATRAPRLGEIVPASLPEDSADLAHGRHYLPYGVPAMKRVAAKAGQRACRFGSLIAIDGHHQVDARLVDGAGRYLPIWSGCRLIGAGEVLLLGDHPASFDSRYFGPSAISAIHAVVDSVLPVEPARRRH